MREITAKIVARWTDLQGKEHETVPLVFGVDKDSTFPDVVTRGYGIMNAHIPSFNEISHMTLYLENSSFMFRGQRG